MTCFPVKVMDYFAKNSTHTHIQRTLSVMGSATPKCGFVTDTATCTLSEKKDFQWFFRTVKGSTWNLLLSEPG